MQLSTAEALVSAAEDLGVKGVWLRKEYSGRGMYGRHTVAVVVPRAVVLAALGARAVFRMTDPVHGVEPDATSRFVNELAKLNIDNMGHDWVVY